MVKNKKGFIIVTTLVVAAAISLMLGAFSIAVFYRNQTALRYMNSVKAYYLAYAGIQYGSTARVNGQFQFTLTDPKDTIRVNYNDPGGLENYTITTTCTAKASGVAKTVTYWEDSNPCTRLYNIRSVIKWE